MNHAPHPVVLRRPRFLGGGEGPAVLRLTQQRAVPMLFEQLRHPELRAKLHEKLIPADDPTLYLPVHRTFNVVLFEAWCDVPGAPRVDPASVTGAGLVIRRRLPRAGRHAPPEQWLLEPGAVLGWRTTPRLDDDPDASQRPRVSSGSAAVDRALEARRGLQPDVSESVTRLFVLPPAICEAVGATLVFGIVQAATPERAQPGGLTRDETPTTPPGGAYTDAEIRSQIPGWLRASSSPRTIPSRLRGRRFRVVSGGTRGNLIQRRTNSGSWEDFDVVDPWRPLGNAVQSTQTSERHFMRMLSQLQLQWNTWGPGANPLRTTLEGIPIPGRGTASSVLRDAAAVFVLRAENAQVTLPETWPVLPSATGEAAKGAVGSVMQAQLDRIVQNEGRYDRPQARYQLRGFIRVQKDPACPPDLVWSEDSDLLRIARWYEGPPDGAVRPTIEMPSLGMLKNIRPNVNIRVPRDIFNFLQNNDPKDFVSGDAKDDRSGPDLMWICTFNFAIIFTIAFMLLINFVFLLNFIFWWVPFFRICIPLPAGLFADEES